MKLFSRIFWGLLFIIAAVVIVLSGFNIIPLELTLTLRIILFSFLAAGSIISLFHFEWLGVFLPIAIITQLSKGFGYIPADTSWYVIWGVAGLLIIGFSILLPKRLIKSKNTKYGKRYSKSESSEEKVQSYTHFGGNTKYITSKNLETISVECSFGGSEIYLTEAELNEKGAVVDLNISFGGVQIYVPKHWQINNDADCVMGGIDFEGRAVESAGDSPKLTLVGKVVFSGLTIVYV